MPFGPVGAGRSCGENATDIAANGATVHTGFACVPSQINDVAIEVFPGMSSTPQGLIDSHIDSHGKRIRCDAVARVEAVLDVGWFRNYEARVATRSSEG